MNLIFNQSQIQPIRQLLSSSETLGTVGHCIALKTFGEDIYEWEQPTLGLEFENEFKVPINSAMLNRTSFLIAVLQSDSFYRDWVTFSTVCSALCDDDGEPNVDEPMITPILAWGALEVTLQDSDPTPWSGEIKKYAGIIMDRDGLIEPMPSLSFAIMPQRFHGSGASSDAHLGARDSEHRLVYDQYLKDQSTLLFQQICMLPWMDETKVRELSNYVAQSM